jgi:hypothetical protein
MARKRALQRWGYIYSKLRGHTSIYMACFEIPGKKEWTKDTASTSTSLRPHILSNRKSQRNCKLLRKPVHMAWLVWLWPRTTGGGQCPSSTGYRWWRHPCDVSEEIQSLKFRKSCYTQYNSVNNATISITHFHHDIFRPQRAIIRCLSYAKMSTECTLFHIT